MPNLNIQLFNFVNNGAGYYHLLDLLFIIVTSDYTAAALIVLVFVYLLTVICRRQGRERIEALKYAVMVALSLGVTYIVVDIIKLAVAFPRPFQTLKHIHVLISLPDSYSFPSAHAAITMALATAVYIKHRRLGEILFALAFIIGLSRIYVGVHYPMDVAVGFLIGYLIPKLFQHFFIEKETLKLQ